MKRVSIIIAIVLGLLVVTLGSYYAYNLYQRTVSSYNNELSEKNSQIKNLSTEKINLADVNTQLQKSNDILAKKIENGAVKSKVYECRYVEQKVSFTVPVSFGCIVQQDHYLSEKFKVDGEDETFLSSHDSDALTLAITDSKRGISIQLSKDGFGRGDQCGFDAGSKPNIDCYMRKVLISNGYDIDEYIVKGKLTEMIGSLKIKNKEISVMIDRYSNSNLDKNKAEIIEILNSIKAIK